MGSHKADRRAWTRRDFMRAGLATGGAMALAAHAHGGMLPVSAVAGTALLTFARIIRLDADIDDELQATV